MGLMIKVLAEKKTQRRPRIRGIGLAAEVLGVSRSHLWRVLQGESKNEALKKRWETWRAGTAAFASPMQAKIGSGIGYALWERGDYDQELFEDWTLSEYQASCRAAEKVAEAQANHARHAFTAGFLLRDFKEFLEREGATSPTQWAWGGLPAVKNKFEAWLDAKSVPAAAARRWMKAAEDIARAIFRLKAGDALPASLDSDGKGISLGETLYMQEDELSGQALEFRHRVLHFLINKSLHAATMAALSIMPAGGATGEGSGKKGKL